MAVHGEIYSLSPKILVPPAPAKYQASERTTLVSIVLS